MSYSAQDQSTLDASFHDIGKIINWEKIGLRGTKLDGSLEYDPHEFEKCIDENWQSPEWGIDPSATPWRSILTWHNGWVVEYGKSWHRWHTKVADWLACSYARPLTEEEKRKLRADPSYGVYTLWTGLRQQDCRIVDPEKVRDLIRLLNTSPSWACVSSTYKDQLQARPEDARPGFDVTSVLAHSTAVGKLGRLLARVCHQMKGLNPGGGITKKAVCGMQRPPSIVVSHFRLGFRQRVFRARDLGVFVYMEKKLDEIADDFSDNILTRFGFEGVAVFESADSRSSFLRRLDEAGFVIEEQILDKTLN
ncbi:MAG: hypothetical protein N3B12_01130 [Armatimonadetes bacterium]|nr:hypothetical protein [Armatimonadota bacterium]